MKKLTLLIIPEDANSIKELKIPAYFLKLAVAFSLVLCSVLGFVLLDYFELTSIRANYYSLESENAGLKGEARILMANLEDVKGSLKKVEDYMSKLGELTRLRVEQVSKKTGIGPLSPEEYTTAMRNTHPAEGHKASTMPFGLNVEKLIFQPVFGRLNEVGKMANDQALELQQLLSTLSQRRSLLSSIPSVSPVQGWITSGFGKRVSPFTGKISSHKGIDVAAPIGTAIRAPADGVVIFTGAKSGFGNFIMIAHGYGIVSRFGHNAQNMVHPGQRVKRGEQIGSVGMTGRTTGPHLHYEVWVNGNPVDPKKFILDINP